MAISLFTFIAVVVFILGGVASFILVTINVSKSHNENAVDVRQILRAYSYVVCAITVVLLTIGMSLVLKSAFGFAAGSQFSYNMEPYYDYGPAKPVEDGGDYAIPNPTTTVDDSRPIVTINGQKYYSPEKLMMQDLINGIILTFTSVFFLIIHLLILVKLNYKGLSFLTKIYIFNMLAVFSVTSLIIVPTAIYAVVNYVFFPVTNTNTYDFGRLLPGEYLAIAIVSTILWIYYLVRVMRYFSLGKKSA